MNENRKSRLRRYGIALLSASGLFLLGGALLAWSWNAFVSELFGLPPMSFRQAIAAGVLVGILGVIAAGTIRLSNLGPAHPGRGASS
jgi:hypothetical protein